MPEFYKHWLKSINEPEAGAFNCSSCFMLKPSGLTRDLGPFKVGLKCCTFHPFLPAFTLGALLERPTFSDDFMNGYLNASRLTPLGAFPRRSGTSICDTGKNEVDACAFLSKDGLAECTIRDFRPSTCAGYVCRSKLGSAGLKKWKVWEDSLNKFEWTLAHLAAFELGRTFDDVDKEFRFLPEALEYYRRAYVVALGLRFESDLGARAGDTVDVSG